MLSYSSRKARWSRHKAHSNPFPASRPGVTLREGAQRQSLAGIEPGTNADWQERWNFAWRWN